MLKGNRFAILRPVTPPQAAPPQDRNITSLDRRDRRIRDSREIRRRRDAKRARRNFQAVQMLDEQLSREFDRTLEQANTKRLLPTKLPAPRQARVPASRVLPSPCSAPLQATQALPSPQPTPTSPTPPRLPLLTFGGLDLIDDCLSLSPAKLSPSPRLPSPILPSLPSWCPALPALTSNLKLGELPMFFDLSHLSESTATSKTENKAQRVQVWRPTPSKIPRKVSHHSSLPLTSKSSDKVAVTACKLHSSNKVSEDLLEAEQTIPTQDQPDLSTGDNSNETSAATLWRILLSPEEATYDASHDSYLNDSTYQPTKPVLAAPYEIYDHHIDSGDAPVELDATAIPFVHANSLTGHANERGSDTFLAPDPGVFIHDTALHGPVEEFMLGLNEYVVDQEYTQCALETLPPLPTSPAPMENVLAEAPAVVSKSEDTVMQITEQSPGATDEQYNSECALFYLATAAEELVDDDLVDVATFLTSAHGSDCWCDECQWNWPEFNDYTFTIYDDAWPECLSRLQPGPPAAEDDWDWADGAPATVVGDEGMGIAGGHVTAQPSWEEFFPCRPSSLAHRAW